MHATLGPQTSTALLAAPTKNQRIFLRAQGEMGLVGSTARIVAHNAVTMLATQIALLVTWALTIFLAFVVIVIIEETAHVQISDTLMGVVGFAVYLSVVPLLSMLYYAVVLQASEASSGLRPRLWRTLRRLSLRGVGNLLLGNVLLFLVFELPMIAALAAVALMIALVKAPQGIMFVGIAIAMILMAAGFVAAFWLAIRLAFTNQVVVVERLGIVAALKRSSSIVKGRFWRVVRGLFVGLICWVLLLMPAYLYLQIATAAHVSTVIPWTLYAVSSGLGFIAFGTYATLFYYSLRLERHDISFDDVLDFRAYEAL